MSTWMVRMASARPTPLGGCWYPSAPPLLLPHLLGVAGTPLPLPSSSHTSWGLLVPLCPSSAPPTPPGGCWYPLLPPPDGWELSLHLQCCAYLSCPLLMGGNSPHTLSVLCVPFLPPPDYWYTYNTDNDVHVVCFYLQPNQTYTYLHIGCRCRCPRHTCTHLQIGCLCSS